MSTQEMLRLFVGLEPTPAFWDALAELQNRLRAAGVEGRYLAPSNLHMTLAFIGMWQKDSPIPLPKVEKPFPITLSHLGVFEQAKVLWAGVEASEELNQLAAQVRQKLDEADAPYTQQDFNPHITLIRKPVLPYEGALTDVAIPHAAMTVTEVCLYRSDHEADGMKYTVIGKSEGTI